MNTGVGRADIKDVSGERGLLSAIAEEPMKVLEGRSSMWTVWCVGTTVAARSRDLLNLALGYGGVEMGLAGVR